MKHLKKFNEELNPETYIKISNKLSKLGHQVKAKEYEKHAIDLIFKKMKNSWEKLVLKYSKYGKVNKNNFDFYPVYEIDYMGYNYISQDSEHLYFDIVEGLIPCDLEGLEYIYSQNNWDCKLIEFNNTLIPIVYTRVFNFNIQKDHGFSVVSEVEEYVGREFNDYIISHKFRYKDQKSARHCYKLFKSLFDENSDYPYAPFPFVEDSRDVQTIYDYINNIIVAPNSADTGINDVSEFYDKFLEKFSNHYTFFKSDLV